MQPSSRHVFTLKPQAGEPCGAIILSFSGHWYDIFKKKSPLVVFRKKGPESFSPDLIYAYFASPVHAVAAKLSVADYQQVPVANAIRLAEKGLMTEESLGAYAARHSHLKVFHVNGLLLARKPISLDLMVTNFHFWPSSNYVPLSKAGASALDTLASFEPQ